jgi:hypothetical protein
MKTTEGVTPKPGALIWYVNYFGQIVPTIFKQRLKGSVKYFSIHSNAVQYVEQNKDKPRCGLPR